MNTSRVKVNKFLLAVVGLFGATILMSVVTVMQGQSASAIAKTTYTNLDLSGSWATPRGTASGGYTAAENSLSQSVDNTLADANPSNQTEALAKTIPDSSAIGAKRIKKLKNITKTETPNRRL